MQNMFVHHAVFAFYEWMTSWGHNPWPINYEWNWCVATPIFINPSCPLELVMWLVQSRQQYRFIQVIIFLETTKLCLEFPAYYHIHYISQFMQWTSVNAQILLNGSYLRMFEVPGATLLLSILSGKTFF